MLRTDKNAHFARERWTIAALLTGRYVFASGAQVFAPHWKRRSLQRLLAAARATPVPVLSSGARTWWAYQDAFYWEDDALEPEDVHALLHERELRRQRSLDRAHALMHAGAPPARGRRGGLSQETKRLVWERCAGRCAECDSDQLLEFDHVIPLAMGGSDSARNLQLLCAPCNRAKGAAL